MQVEEKIHQYFLENNKTLSLAESCTGGDIAAALTKLPGASGYFLGSMVCYANEVKSRLLAVEDSLLATKGAVSPEVAGQMLAGLLALTKSDYGIAVTGIAGPGGGSPEKPVGTVWAAIGSRSHPPLIWKIEAGNDRKKGIRTTRKQVLQKLLAYAKKTS